MMPSSAPARLPSHCSVKPTPCLMPLSYSQLHSVQLSGATLWWFNLGCDFALTMFTVANHRSMLLQGTDNATTRQHSLLQLPLQVHNKYGTLALLLPWQAHFGIFGIQAAFIEALGIGRRLGVVLPCFRWSAVECCHPLHLLQSQC